MVRCYARISINGSSMPNQRINQARLDKVSLSGSDRLMAGKKNDNEKQLFELASILQGEALVNNDV